MFGIEREPVVSQGETRKQLLLERDQRVCQHLRDRVPVETIAVLEGLEGGYCAKISRRLAREHGIDYDPDKPRLQPVRTLPAGITDASQALRAALANTLYNYRRTRHPLEVARETGLTQDAQKVATERPNGHDWTLSQMERLARASGESFKMQMLRHLLAPDELQKVTRCLNS